MAITSSRVSDVSRRTASSEISSARPTLLDRINGSPAEVKKMIIKAFVDEFEDERIIEFRKNTVEKRFIKNIEGMGNGFRDLKCWRIHDTSDTIKKLIEYSFIWGGSRPCFEFFKLLEAKYDLAVKDAMVQVQKYHGAKQNVEEKLNRPSGIPMIMQTFLEQATEERMIMDQAKDEVKAASEILAMLVKHTE